MVFLHVFSLAIFGFFGQTEKRLSENRTEVVDFGIENFSFALLHTILNLSPSRRIRDRCLITCFPDMARCSQAGLLVPSSSLVRALDRGPGDRSLQRPFAWRAMRRIPDGPVIL